MACITGHQKSFGIASAARVLIAENEEEAFEAAMRNCEKSFPTAQGYVIHQAHVTKLCDEKTDLTMVHPNGERHTLTLTKQS